MIYTLGSLLGVRWFPFLCGCRGTKIRPRFLGDANYSGMGFGMSVGDTHYIQGYSTAIKRLNPNQTNTFKTSKYIFIQPFMHPQLLCPPTRTTKEYILPTIILPKIIGKKKKENDHHNYIP